MTSAFPSNVSRIWLVGRFIDLSGAPMKGAVTFTPSPSVMLNQGSKQIISGKPFSATLSNDTGYFQVQLPATNDPDMDPQGWTYSVLEPTGRRYNIVVPYDTPLLSDAADPLNGQQVIDLITVTPAPSPQSGTVQLIKARGISGMTATPAGIDVAYDDGSTQSLSLAGVVGATTVVHPQLPPAALWPWYAALAGRESTPCDVMVIGDSISEGGSVSNIEHRWLHKFRDKVRARFPTAGVTGGQGYIAARFVAATFPSGWTYAGAISNGTQGLGQRAAALSSPDGSMRRTVVGTSIRLLYLQFSGGGTFVVRNMSTNAVIATVNTAGALNYSKAQDVTLGAAGTYDIRIEWSAGSAVYVGGLMVFNGDETTGIRFWDASQWGIAAKQYGTDTVAAGITSYWAATVKPDLVIIELGANDFFGNVPPADVRADIEHIIASMRSGGAQPISFLLVGVYKLYATQTYPWSAYRDQLAAIAAANPNDVAFVDLYNRWPAGDGIDALDVLDNDNTHPNRKGHELIASYMTEFVTPY